MTDKQKELVTLRRQLQQVKILGKTTEDAQKLTSNTAVASQARERLVRRIGSIARAEFDIMNHEPSPESLYKICISGIHIECSQYWASEQGRDGLDRMFEGWHDALKKARTDLERIFKEKEQPTQTVH